MSVSSVSLPFIYRQRPNNTIPYPFIIRVTLLAVDNGSLLDDAQQLIR